MLWDGLIILLIIGLAVAGWNVGIVNSWRGPVAVIIATIAAQQFYVDFSTWIVQQLRVSPDQAIAIGYVLLWGAVEITLEILLGVLVPLGSKNRPMFFSRAAGAGLGLVRALIIILLPCMVLLGPIKVPAAPADKSPLINPMQSGIDKSVLLPIFKNLAQGLYPALNPVVVSTKAPSFKPNFQGNNAVDDMNQRDRDNAK